MYRKSSLITGLITAGLLLARGARADVIDFDSEGLTGPSLASETAAGTITVSTSIGNVIFSGGAILTNEANLPADPTSVYYTSFFLSGGTNPITITFPRPINNFFLDVYNGETYADMFTVSDNMGKSTTVSLPNNTSGGNALVSFPAIGDVVTISTTDTSGFDFSIDNIGFNQPTPNSSTPEPATWVLLGAGFLGLGFVRRLCLSRY